MAETKSNNASRKNSKQNLWITLAVDSTQSWTRLGRTYSDDLITFPEWLCTYQKVITADISEYLEILNVRGVFVFGRFAVDDKGNMCIFPYFIGKRRPRCCYC